MRYCTFDAPLNIIADSTLVVFTTFFQYGGVKKVPFLWYVVIRCCEMD